METTQTIFPVQIVTIKNKIPLFKGEDQANSIEKIEIEENGFSLVAQKDLYQIGDKAVYIQPDYSLSDISLFDSFIRPFGDSKKSKLGSNNRIRAIKFNLHTGDDEPTYSVGILLPIEDLIKYFSEKWNTPLEKVSKTINHNLSLLHLSMDLAGELGITKWEEPDTTRGGIKTNGGMDFPSTIYKTDETNINNLWGHIEKNIGYPVKFIGTEKIDGSSISIILKDGKFSVGSRNLIKPEFIEKVTGRKKPNFFQKIGMMFGYKPELLIKEMVENDDEFITLSKPYIQKIKDKLGENITTHDFVFRGEANGKSWKGSGNKNNPNSKEEPNIKFFGIDYYTDVAVRMSEDSFKSIINSMGLERTKVVFEKIFSSREEIEKVCKEYFKTNMVEGIVLRTLDSKFSGKLMNDEYDSKK
jgi:hypothetical protein